MYRSIRIISALVIVNLVAGAITGYAQTRTEDQPRTQTMSKRPHRDIGTFMSVGEAHNKALKKELVLIDIRSPDEWRESGVPASATPLTMHQSAAAFFGGLNRLTLFDKSRPIALICATGVRTTFLQKILRQQGYRNIINVAEGMYGSKYGPGWLKSGLPVKPYRGRRSPPKPAK